MSEDNKSSKKADKSNEPSDYERARKFSMPISYGHRRNLDALPSLSTFEKSVIPLNNYQTGTKLDEIPALALEDEKYAYDMLNWRLDPKIMEIEEKMLIDNAHNREWCFRVDNLAQTVAFSIFRLMIGSGLTIKCKKEEAVDYLNEWMKNVRKTPSVYSISSMIRDVVVDNLKHGESLFIRRKVKLDSRGFTFVKGYSNEPESKDQVDLEALAIHRVDMRTIRTIEHDFTANKKWIQYAYVDYELAEQDSVKRFYDKDYIPGGIASVDSDAPLPRSKIHTTQIIDRQAVHFNLFTTPPISTVMQEIAYKRWIMWAMRVAAERTAIPEKWVKIGTEEHHPEDDIYPDVLENAVEQLQEARGGDVFVVPYTWDVVMPPAQGQKMSFVEDLNHLNEQIVLGLGSHMALYQASGSDLATSTVIEDMLIRAIQGMRKEIAIILEDLFYDVLSIAGMDLDKNKESEEIEIVWSPLKVEAYSDFVNVVISLATTEVKGQTILKDVNEVRAMLEPFLGLEPLPEEFNAPKDDEDFDTSDSSGNSGTSGDNSKVGTEKKPNINPSSRPKPAEETEAYKEGKK